MPKPRRRPPNKKKRPATPPRRERTRRRRTASSQPTQRVLITGDALGFSESLTPKVRRRRGRPQGTQDEARAEFFRRYPPGTLGPDDRPLGATRLASLFFKDYGRRVDPRTMARWLRDARSRR